jgi:Calponin homology (CH) domain
MQAYLSWVNAQLKKKPGRQCISDLPNDMKDGTAFADLIEVVGKLLVFVGLSF